MFSLEKGQMQPYGVSVYDEGCNFSIYCPDAESVYLCFFDENEEEIQRIQLKERIQSKWFGFIKGASVGHYYGYRVATKTRRNLVNNTIDKLLIDPYAKKLTRPLHWDEDLYAGDSCHMIPKCVIVDDDEHKVPHRLISRPQAVDAKARVVYEAHVKGLSKLHPEVPDDIRGTYLGASHPSVIKHIQSLGVTSVQFLPLMAFMPEPFLNGKELTNYWGYNPVNFFSAEPRYAYSDAYTECREMIKAYRTAGLEVILDVVFNHTAEAGDSGTIISFKGFCTSHAYLLEQHDESDSVNFTNYSGCGNTVQVSDTYMLNLILDAMRYWVSEMGVSGFRFDLAATLGRQTFEYRKNAGFFKIIEQDPILKSAVMIAEPWDIGPGGYQLGHFPAHWLEVNDKFRDSTRAFWRGDKGVKGDFATRIMGSRDVFVKTKRPMHSSINNITYHDGFTLHDLVCFENKHNEANLESNRDGHNHNLSANYGVEGLTDDNDINDVRYQQKRNLFATLVLSQGTPHILAGDELSKTQHGNNNAYCQDNEINYLDWQLGERQQSFLAYCQYVIQLRQRYPMLQCMSFSDDQFDNNVNIALADWYRTDGSHKTDIDWVNHEHHCFALHIIATVEHNEQEWVFCYNSADTDKKYHLPVLSRTAIKNKNISNRAWVCKLDTSNGCIDEFVSGISKMKVSPVFTMPARSFRLFLKE
ncbi:glycogen debranching protein GlgX [Agaribacter marinus]|uniref:Glycogen operon protein GlgX homolog n=1 Tax=Agaribacter marinus TaxID=1431249 RepID=A0AA37SZX9_9ALTE|nr:glycogen debranching protein GlgX [Agaribacter marinus]GLR69713.1 glycogen operon protein GlgX homolog [Agaribacter marinus]